MLNFEVHSKQEQAVLELYTDNIAIEKADYHYTLFNENLECKEEIIIKELTATNKQKIQLIFCSITKEVLAFISNKEGELIKIKNENMPKELKYLDSTAVLEAYCTNIYAKVVKLSDNDYKFYLQHQGLGGMLNTTKSQPSSHQLPPPPPPHLPQPLPLQSSVMGIAGASTIFSDISESKSITPRGEGGADIQKIPLQLTSNIISNELQAINSEISNLRNKVLSCNNITEEISRLEQLSPINNNLFVCLKLLDYLSNIIDNVYIKEYKFTQHQNNPVIIKRYVINPVKLGFLIDTPLSKQQLHHIEKVGFGFAIEEVNLKDSTEEVIKKQIPRQTSENVVLVDFFTRKDGVIVKDLQTSCAEVHTVCLWKENNNKITLIDPNNLTFSEYIPTILNQNGSNIRIESMKHEESKFYMYDSNRLGIQQPGYSNYDDIKPKPRDCIDIALKIALKINESQVNRLTIKDIEDDINSLSNQYKVNAKIGQANHNTCIRQLQSSSPQLREKLTLPINLFGAFQDLGNIKPSTLKELEFLCNFQQSIDLFKNNFPNPNYLNKINIKTEIKK